MIGGWHQRPPRDFDKRVDAQLKLIFEVLEINTAYLKSIENRTRRLMSDQETADQIAAQIESDVKAEGTDLDAIKAALAAIQQQNPAVDFTALNAAVADLDAGKAAEDAVANPAPPETPV